MLSATTFTYDGVFSGECGLKIATIGGENIRDTVPFSAVVLGDKTARGRRFLYSGLESLDMPQFEFCVLSEAALPDIVQREILTWLTHRKGFKKLQLHQPEYHEYSYNCIFSEVGKVYVNGNCHGFNLTATFDSEYCYGTPQVKSISSNGDSWVDFMLINNSDIIDEYVYPIVTFSNNATGARRNIQVINDTDNTTRVFEYNGIVPPEQIVIDNELKIITSTHGGNKLENFNRNWLRLVKGINKLRIRINGTCKIEYPTLVKIGF